MKERIDQLFEQLDLAFRALRGLSSLRRGNRTFREVLRDFQRLLMEAGGHGWEDRQKRAYLDHALNAEMEDKLITVEKSTFRITCIMPRGRRWENTPLPSVRRAICCSGEVVGLFETQGRRTLALALSL